MRTASKRTFAWKLFKKTGRLRLTAFEFEFVSSEGDTCNLKGGQAEPLSDHWSNGPLASDQQQQQQQQQQTELLSYRCASRRRAAVRSQTDSSAAQVGPLHCVSAAPNSFFFYFTLSNLRLPACVKPMRNSYYRPSLRQGPLLRRLLLFRPRLLFPAAAVSLFLALAALYKGCASLTGSSSYSSSSSSNKGAAPEILPSDSVGFSSNSTSSSSGGPLTSNSNISSFWGPLSSNSTISSFWGPLDSSSTVSGSDSPWSGSSRSSLYSGSSSSSGTSSSVEDSEFPAIVLSRLLAPPPGGWGGAGGDLAAAEAQQQKAPFACLVVAVADGDTLHCVKVDTDAAVFSFASQQQLQAVAPLSAVLQTPSEVYVHRKEKPQLRLDPWPSRCGTLAACATKVRLYGIDTPEMARGPPSARKSGGSHKNGEGPFPTPPTSAQASPPAQEGVRGVPPSESAAQEGGGGPPGGGAGVAAPSKPLPPYGSAELDVGGQALGVAAAASLADQTLGRVVLLQPLKKDNFGRTLGRVLLPTVAFRQLDGAPAFALFFQRLFARIALEAGKALLGRLGDLRFQQVVGMLLQLLRQSEGAGGPSVLEGLPWAREALGFLLEGLLPLDPASTNKPTTSQQQTDSPAAAAAAAVAAGAAGRPQAADRRREVSLRFPGAPVAYLMQLLQDLEPPLLVDASEVLVQQGLSHLYGGGALGGNKERLQQLLQTAKENRRGLWGLPPSLHRSPKQYRKEMRRWGPRAEEDLLAAGGPPRGRGGPP
ncbi:hypothetical protein Efla_001650 [Eimeria flavescens]